MVCHLMFIQQFFTMLDRYQILKGYQNNDLTIGFGSYGQVKLAKDLKTETIVAIKVIYKIAQNEILMHSKLSHPNIITLIDIHIDPIKEITYLILEYAEKSTLYDKIKMNRLGKTQIKKYFKEICQGVAYLHQHNIMHRDIKPQNILITKDNQVKLCDFGVATFLSERSTLCGTYEYMAPEMIQNKSYDYKIDVWALGILLFEMIAGHAPFRGDKPEVVLEKMKTKIYFGDNFDREDISIIKFLLRVTPAKRPEVKELLQHSYFTSQEILQKKSTSTYQGSSMISSNQLCQSSRQRQMFEQYKRMQISSKKRTYPPFYISQQNQDRKVQKTKSFYGQKFKKQQNANIRIPSFISSSQKFIKPLQIDSRSKNSKNEQNSQCASPISPLSFRRAKNKSIVQNLLNIEKQV